MTTKFIVYGVIWIFIGYTRYRFIKMADKKVDLKITEYINYIEEDPKLREKLLNNKHYYDLFKANKIILGLQIWDYDFDKLIKKEYRHNLNSVQDLEVDKVTGIVTVTSFKEYNECTAKWEKKYSH